MSLAPPEFLPLTYLTIPTDVTVFAIILVKTHIIKSRHLMNRSRILNTVSRDAEIYFVIITTCHFLIVVMILAARVGILCTGSRA